MPLNHYKREELIWASPLPGNEKLLLLALNSFVDGNGECFPGVETLASMCSISARTVVRLTESLVEKGAITKNVRTKKSGKRTSNLYRIIFQREISVSNPHDNLSHDKLSCDNDDQKRSNPCDNDDQKRSNPCDRLSPDLSRSNEFNYPVDPLTLQFPPPPQGKNPEERGEGEDQNQTAEAQINSSSLESRSKTSQPHRSTQTGTKNSAAAPNDRYNACSNFEAQFTGVDQVVQDLPWVIKAVNKRRNHYEYDARMIEIAIKKLSLWSQHKDSRPTIGDAKGYISQGNLDTPDGDKVLGKLWGWWEEVQESKKSQNSLAAKNKPRYTKEEIDRIAREQSDRELGIL